jgi:hypothetical protein
MRVSRIIIALIVGAGLVALNGGPMGTNRAEAVALCSNTYVEDLTALTDLGPGFYQGQQGGLYPGGANSMPAGHLELGLSLAGQVQPRASNGAPSVNGKVGLLAIGVSSTSEDFGAFQALAGADPRKAPSVVLVNGGVSGHPIDTWLDPKGEPWAVVDSRLGEAGISAGQVQVVWVMLPDRDGLPEPFPAQQVEYKEKLETVLRLLRARFPNLVLGYLSSHGYTGYAIGHPNFEPVGYEYGFGVKWLIEDQISGLGDINPDPSQGAVTAPWVAWGPYLWANGLGPDGAPGGVPGRSDGLEWECSDFELDGIHPSSSGEAKSAELLLQHFTTDPTACGWFLKDGVPCGGPPTFVDIGESIFAADIIWLAQQGITKGCNPPTNDRFCPKLDVDRGAMAAFLKRALNLPPANRDFFIDDNNSIFENDINAIAKAGITKGCNPPTNDRFCPKLVVDRGAMAAFLRRALNLPPANRDFFIDDNNSIFETDINAIAKAGITKGCNPPTNDRYCPGESVSREAMAAFLHRALE